MATLKKGAGHDGLSTIAGRARHDVGPDFLTIAEQRTLLAITAGEHPTMVDLDKRLRRLGDRVGVMGLYKRLASMRRRRLVVVKRLLRRNGSATPSCTTVVPTSLGLMLLRRAKASFNAWGKPRRILPQQAHTRTGS